MGTFTGGVTMVTMTCTHHEGCGIVFALTETMRDELKNSHKIFYCPNGHPRWFPTGTSDEEKLRREHNRLKQKQAELLDVIDGKNKEIRHQKNTVRAEKGAKTKLKRRVAHDVCPCCHKNFKHLRDHMKRQHPEEVTNV